jgi:AbrB family looped-hinge helix DNA binding protein
MNAETKVSAKGQIVIPKSVRDELDWPAGTRLEVEKVGGAVTLRPIESRLGTLTIEEFKKRVPPHRGSALTLAEMDAAVAKGMTEHFRKEYKLDT